MVFNAPDSRARKKVLRGRDICFKVRAFDLRQCLTGFRSNVALIERPRGNYSCHEAALFIRKEKSMASAKTAVLTFIADEDGAALAEYGILVAFIAIVAIVAVTLFGSKISEKFSEYASKLN